jgi:hypothetical protein
MMDILFFALIAFLFLLVIMREYKASYRPQHEILTAIRDLRSRLEKEMSVEADALKAALDAFEPKVVAFIAAHANDKVLLADAVADKAALADAKAKIDALSAQLDAAVV